MDKKDQLILVTGATGHQGGAVVRYLIDHRAELKFPLRALVRNPNSPKAQQLAADGVEIVQGDFDDRSSLERALEGVHGVFAVQDFYSAGYEGEIRQGKTIADAAKAAGISHLIYSSVGSADRNTGIPHFESKWRIEQHIREIGVHHTIFRPVFFYYNYERMRDAILAGMLTQPLSPERPVQQLSEYDYARMVVTAFENPTRYLDREIEVASTELSMLQVAEVFSHVTGQTVGYQRVSWNDFEKQAGKELTTMYRWFEDVGYRANLNMLRTEFGELTSLDAYLRQHGWETTAAAPARAMQSTETQM